MTSVADIRAEPHLGPVRVMRGDSPAPVEEGAHRAGGAVARAVVHGVLRWLHDGRLHLVEAGRTSSYGSTLSGTGEAASAEAGVGEPGLEATVRVHSPRAYSALVAERSVGLGRGYFDGLWDCDDLVSLIRILLRLARPTERRAGSLARLSAPVLDRLGRARHREDRERDRSFISAHYDLGDEMFATFLDETMMYSCAVFDSPQTPLAEASAAKLENICTKLALRPGQRVVEIGGGWGGFAIHAAKRFGVKVTTTTISARQYDYMVERVRSAGLADRITVVQSDYRDLAGTFDALVSIEMIEAVDWRDHDTFFGACSRLLAPGGLMGLQAIVIGDRSFERAKHSEDFLKRFIFPGSCIPSIGAIVASASCAGGLRVVDLEDIGRHYAETLARWRVAFDAAGEEHRRMGLDERFRRLWRFYLAYCEAGFLEAHVSDVQVVLAKPGWRAPLATRGH
ncbi:MAG: class I SAM-dependent methyltransferase [Acidimicrobiales bacterium]